MNENLNLVDILNDCPIGSKVGKLTVIREVERVRHPNGKTSRRFECMCDCGNKTQVFLSNLKKNHSTSCGHCRRDSFKIKIVQNQKFGRLTIIREMEPKIGSNGKKVRYVECLCECGKICHVRFHALKRGHVKSCGCLSSETIVKYFTKHGLTNKHPLYAVWKGIKARCTNPKSHAYKDYGGRGINVYDGWISDFGTFYNWCLSNGWKQGLTVDRIDNNKGYYPDNCRFVDIITQARNKRNNREITYKGKTWHSVAQFCSDMGLCYKRFYQRIKRGMSVERAVSLG